MFQRDAWLARPGRFASRGERRSSDGPPALARRCVDSLEPYAWNSRTHSNAQIKQIAASITEFGVMRPIFHSRLNQAPAIDGGIEFSLGDLVGSKN